MSKYQAITQDLPENTTLNVQKKCHKVKKSSGKLMYEVSLDSETNTYILKVDNITTTKRLSTGIDSETKEFNLSEILKNLEVKKNFGSIAKLLPFIDNHHDVGFIAAALLDLKIIKRV